MLDRVLGPQFEPPDETFKSLAKKIERIEKEDEFEYKVWKILASCQFLLIFNLLFISEIGYPGNYQLPSNPFESPKITTKVAEVKTKVEGVRYYAIVEKIK